MDFNNPVSNDRAVSHGGDTVSADDATTMRTCAVLPTPLPPPRPNASKIRRSEQIFIDTRRFHGRVQACALTASQFTGTFGEVRLESLDVTIKHLVFVESSQPADTVKVPWNERTLIAVNPLFSSSLKLEAPRERPPSATLSLKGRPDPLPTELIDKDANFVVLFTVTRASLEATSLSGPPPKKVIYRVQPVDICEGAVMNLYERRDR